jgi:hypothetical protein
LCVEQQLDEIRQRVNTHDQAADRQGHDTATVHEVAALGERIRVLEDLVAQLVASVQAVVVPVQQTVATQQTMTGQLERLMQYQAEATTTRSHILGRLSHLEHEFLNVCAHDLGHRSVQRACLSPTAAGLQEEHSHSSCCDKRVPCDLGASGTRQMGCGNAAESEEHPHGITGAAECSEDAAAAALAVDLGLEGDLDDTAAWADYEDLEGHGREALTTDLLAGILQDVLGTPADQAAHLLQNATPGVISLAFAVAQRQDFDMTALGMARCILQRRALPPWAVGSESNLASMRQCLHNHVEAAFSDILATSRTRAERHRNTDIAFEGYRMFVAALWTEGISRAVGRDDT